MYGQLKSAFSKLAQSTISSSEIIQLLCSELPFTHMLKPIHYTPGDRRPSKFSQIWDNIMLIGMLNITTEWLVAFWEMMDLASFGKVLFNLQWWAVGAFLIKSAYFMEA